MCIEVEIIRIIGGIIAALAAALTAYFAYYSIEIKIVEKHTEELKTILQQWIKQIQEVSIPIESLKDLIKKPASLSLSIEEKVLFNDLIYHLSEYFNVHNMWNEFKRMYDNHCQNLISFSHEIINDLKKLTSTPFNPDWKSSEDKGLNLNCIDIIYWDLIYSIQGEKLCYLSNLRIDKNEIISDRNIIWRGEKIDDVRDALKKIQYKIENSDYFSEEIIGLFNEIINLQNCRQELLKNLEDTLSITFYSQKCKYTQIIKLPFIKQRSYFL